MKIVLKAMRESVQNVYTADWRLELYQKVISNIKLVYNLLRLLNLIILSTGYWIKWKKMFFQCKMSRDWEHRISGKGILFEVYPDF